MSEKLAAPLGQAQSQSAMRLWRPLKMIFWRWPGAKSHLRIDALSRSDSVGKGFRALIFSCLDQIRFNEIGVRREGGAAVHDMRIGLRRLKTVLSL